MNTSLDTAKIKNIVLNFIVPIICIGIASILFAVVIYPSFKNIPELQSKLEATTKLRDQLKDKQSKLSRFIDFKSIVEENSGLVDRVMPAEQNVPGLLDQLSQIAAEAGLDVTKLSYSLSDTGTRDDTKPNYSAVLVSLGADGTYAQMTSFMKAVENASRLVSVSNFRFNAISLVAGDRLSFTFVLNAPFMKVQSNAVTDEPLGLDISSGEFSSFITKIKGLRYFERSGDLKNIGTQVSLEEINAEANQSSQTTPSN